MTLSRSRFLPPYRPIPIAVGLLAFALIALVDSPLHHQEGFGARPAYATAVTVLMAIWWLTEALPIAYTACVPLLLFPVTGVLGGDLVGGIIETAKPYFDKYIFLFAGGMSIAAAMQQWNLHRRIALQIMKRIGTDPKGLLLGFLMSTAFISLWISNTATAAMMLPIGLAVVAQYEARVGRRLEHYGAAIMLAIAYASSVGGIGTKIGTVPNMQLVQFMGQLGTDVSFLQFAVVGFPFVCMFIPVVWLFLWRAAKADVLEDAPNVGLVEDELSRLGPVKRAERIVLFVFLGTATIWILGKPIADALKGEFPGTQFGTADIEGGAAIFAALLLLVFRTGGRQVLEVRSLKAQPWSTLLLIGGSSAMANAIQKGGVSNLIASNLSVLADLSPFLQVFVASFATVGLSAVASNTAANSIMMNVLKSAVSPALLPTILFTATIAASCDFALPAGTPPNAIVFASGYLTVPRMAKTGFPLDLIASLLTALWCFSVVRFVF